MANITNDTSGGVTIGVDMAHYALLTKDEKGEAPVYSEPVPLVNAKSITRNASDSSVTEFYDNAPKVTAVSKGERSLAFVKSAFSNADRQVLLGRKKIGGITVGGGDDFAPSIAFGFRTMKSNGNYSYIWLLKGTLYENEVAAATREANVSFQNQTLNGTFIVRNCDNQDILQIDTDDPDYTDAIGDAWFTAETLNVLYDAEDEGEGDEAAG